MTSPHHLNKRPRAPRGGGMLLKVHEMNAGAGGGLSFKGTVACACKNHVAVVDVGDWRAAVLPIDADIIAAADAISQGACDAAEAWTQADPDWTCLNAHLLVVEAIVIAPDHRGRNLGHDIMRQIIYSVGYGCGVVIISPAPIDEMGVDYEIARSKLREHWLKCEGFQPLDDDHLWLDRGLNNSWLEAI